MADKNLLSLKIFRPSAYFMKWNPVKGVYQPDWNSHVLMLREVMVVGYGIPHSHGSCRTIGGRAPVSQCKFPFRVSV